MDGVRLIIITVPPPAVRTELAGLRRICSEVSSSHAAAAYPPHVTLRTGLIVPQAAMGTFLDEFGCLLEGVGPFEIATGDIVFRTISRDHGAVPIVALEIEPSAALVSLNARLLRYQPYRASGRTSFWPHLTLAFQDLSAEGRLRLEQYIAAGGELRARRFAWCCDNVSLYRQQGVRWQPHHVFRLA
jgi:2'-5' RNA ligase